MTTPAIAQPMKRRARTTSVTMRAVFMSLVLRATKTPSLEVRNVTESEVDSMILNRCHSDMLSEFPRKAMTDLEESTLMVTVIGFCSLLASKPRKKKSLAYSYPGCNWKNNEISDQKFSLKFTHSFKIIKRSNTSFKILTTILKLFVFSKGKCFAKEIRQSLLFQTLRTSVSRWSNLPSMQLNEDWEMKTHRWLFDQLLAFLSADHLITQHLQSRERIGGKAKSQFPEGREWRAIKNEEVCRRTPIIEWSITKISFDYKSATEKFRWTKGSKFLPKEYINTEIERERARERNSRNLLIKILMSWQFLKLMLLRKTSNDCKLSHEDKQMGYTYFTIRREISTT